MWLTTEADDQSSLHCVTVPTDVTSGHIGRRDASRGGSYRLAQKAAECVEVPVLRKRGSPGYIRCLLRTTMTDRVRVLLARRAPADTCCYCARPRVCGPAAASLRADCSPASVGAAAAAAAARPLRQSSTPLSTSKRGRRRV